MQNIAVEEDNRPRLTGDLDQAPLSRHILSHLIGHGVRQAGGHQRGPVGLLMLGGVHGRHLLGVLEAGAHALGARDKLKRPVLLHDVVEQHPGGQRQRLGHTVRPGPERKVTVPFP